MTRRAQARYDLGHDGGGSVIPEIHDVHDHEQACESEGYTGFGDHYDLDRLDRALRLLVDSHQRLERENSALRDAVARHEGRVRELDEQLLDANQRRQEAGKRLDELISQLDHLEAQLAPSGE